MTKTILLTFTLLACSAWMVAQSTPSSSQSPDTSSSPSSSAGQSTGSAASQSSGSQVGSAESQSSGSETTIRGCLNSSGGSYTLTDASGTTYQLQGDSSKLSAHVNNEVEIKGTASGASAAGSTSPSAGSSASTGAASSTGSAAGSQMFNVTKVKKVSGTCSTTK